MTDLVDQMFPPVNRKLAADFTDFNFWRAPMQEYELPNLDPPSPALSAKSDTSRLSRLRNFSLRGSSSSQSLADKAKQQSVPPKGGPGANNKAKASSPLASPVLTANDPEDLEDSASSVAQHRDRLGGMPRSLDDRLLDDPSFGRGSSYNTDILDRHEGSDDHGESESDDQPHDDDEEAEEAFEDDILATGEMDNIPFL